MEILCITEAGIQKLSNALIARSEILTSNAQG
jgi:hypothetical protein